jgi:dTDP-4-amino-4,6-dideoxygalactose transaminase
MDKKRIWLSPPHMGGEEMGFVQEVFDSNWVAPAGPMITDFENELADYAGMKHCAVLSSGTAAIHLALIILGVERGDEVICSSFTFAGSCNPIVYQGATPVFVDSEAMTWNMDPDLLEEAIQDRIKKTGKKPKAIILVHLYGMPAQMDRIMAICRQHEIPLIEDAAEALGSSYQGKKAGSFGDLSIFSFNGNKIITTSGGGALLSNREDYIKKARFLATQARDEAPHYEHSQVGFNYRLSSISSGIGRGQLMVLADRVEKRRANFDYYRHALKDMPSIQFLVEPEGHFSNRWLTTILVNDPEKPDFNRERIRLKLEAENIESRPLWKPMHLQPVFRDCPAYINGISGKLFEHGLCLPSGTDLSEAEIALITKTIHQV